VKVHCLCDAAWVSADVAVSPSGVVTFLFTDVEGSTRRWEADADRMRVALAAHDGVLRGAIEANAGWLFKHTGDGVCAAFASPRSAVDAALAAQRALELPVRMGLATGEAELRAGDYFGAVLNRAARVMAAGHGGQILIDGATAGLVGEDDLIALGPRRLRDIAKPVQIYQVHSPGLRAEFPPLKTLDRTPGNLRPQTTSFVGRETDLVEVEETLSAHRLVTLTGVGGVGKTRLALEVAARSANGFPDGVFVIELAPIADPAAVPDAVAAVLGITQQPEMSLAESVAAALEGRSRLLVFDNCEHVVDAAANMIDAILARSATVKILATSREGLQVTDERLWPVPSLEVNSSAATLFVERAQAVASAISLTENREAVTEICQRLDGIPLAIELAASRMQSMTVTELRERLDDRFRLLVGSRRGLERHQTLRHAVQWSYDLLEESEKNLLTRCSVFAGGFDLPGASAVAGSGDDFATLDLLDRLVRKSLVVADRSSGRTRFSMLETIRQFAEEQLVRSGEAEQTREVHAHYFAGHEADVLALWDSPRQREAYAFFNVELANLRAAFRCAADHGDIDTAAAIAVSAAFLGYWVEQYEPIAWAEELIEPARAVEHRRLAQLYVMAAQCYTVGRIKDAVGYTEAGSLAIGTGHFDQVSSDIESTVGGAYIMQGQPERWAELCRTIIARDPGAQTGTLACLAMALTIAGAEDEAMAASDHLVAAADATDNPNRACFALLGYGFARRDADPVAAHEVLRRSLTIAEDSGNRWVESHLADCLSMLATSHGDPMDAFEYLSLTVRRYYDSGSFSMMPNPLVILAALFDRLGHHEPAAIISGFAVNPFSKIAFPEIHTTITHLREILGDGPYESFARAGKHMTNAAMATYAFDQIDEARAGLNAVPK
jgi:predicted ATPase/class 3 adenylate cyclase